MIVNDWYIKVYTRYISIDDVIYIYTTKWYTKQSQSDPTTPATHADTKASSARSTPRSLFVIPVHGDPYGGARHHGKASFQLQGTKVPFVSRSLGSKRLHEIAWDCFRTEQQEQNRSNRSRLRHRCARNAAWRHCAMEVIHLPKIIQIQVHSTPDSNPELLHQTWDQAGLFNSKFTAILVQQQVSVTCNVEHIPLGWDYAAQKLAWLLSMVQVLKCNFQAASNGSAGERSCRTCRIGPQLDFCSRSIESKMNRFRR